MSELEKEPMMKRRPAEWLDGRGWCYGFTDDGRAIVEHTNGAVQIIKPIGLKFTDGQGENR